jgi:PKD domain
VSYKVGIRADGKEEVRVKTDAKNFKVEEHYEGGILAELEFNKFKLTAYDKQGAEAILGAWPTVDELVLYRKEDDGSWGEIFAGTVTKVDTDDTEVVIAAHMPEVVPPNPLTVAVQEDTDDASRFTVLVTADNDGEGTVALSFGDGSTATGAGDGSGANQHAYVSPGTYTVTATSNADPGRTASQVVVIPFTT